MPTNPPRRFRPRIAAISRYAVVLLASLVLCAGGCPVVPSTTGDGASDTFDTAKPVNFNNDQTEFRAEISSGKDTDIYDLGVLSPGDRLYIDVHTTSGDLDPLAAVFDYRQYLLAFNDDRAPDASNLNPLIDVSVFGAEGTYYLGVAAFPGSGSTGQYDVTIRITRDAGLLNPEPQIVYLNWQGGQNVLIKNVGTFDIGPFDAADVGFPGRTAELKDAIQNVIAARYEGFALILLNSDDDAVPGEPYSTVYFGGNSRNAFAIAEQIDTQNAHHDDNAIVFTSGFYQAFSVTPTFSQMATAIGDTTAHEIGHLLGLVHTKDCDSLMDSTCGNDALLHEQVFKLAPLDTSVFPLGFQNAVELVQWAIGLASS
jgi:hypothetical protein